MIDFSWGISIIGVIFFIFRIWLSQFKLKEELQFRRFYVSRQVNFYFCLMLIFSFQNYIFNYIVVTCLPAMFIASFWDFNFYRKFKTRQYWQKNKTWLLIERLSMHPPMIIVGILLYVFDIRNIIPTSEWWAFIVGIFLVYVPGFLLDYRISKRYSWPKGRDLIIVMLISTIGMVPYILFV